MGGVRKGEEVEGISEGDSDGILEVSMDGVWEVDKVEGISEGDSDGILVEISVGKAEGEKELMIEVGASVDSMDGCADVGELEVGDPLEGDWVGWRTGCSEGSWEDRTSSTYALVGIMHSGAAG